MLGALFVATQIPTALAEVRWGNSALRQDPDWYASAEARAAADTLLLYQSSLGAWPKNTDLFKSVPPEELARILAGSKAKTIDNGATTTPMRFLARVIQATNETKYQDSFTRGLDYLFQAQYPNGGWPQCYPLRKGYYSHITFNDGAMMNVMNLLRDTADGKAPYEFVDKDHCAKAAAAVAKGIDCILRTQIKEDGQLTVWCAQYDETTLEPAWARNFEPPSLSGDESVDIVRFLMGEQRPTPAIIAAIEGAVAWFKATAISGLNYERGMTADGKRDGKVTADPNAGPIWARFYELGSNRPLFVGRDKEFNYSYDKVERERRGGYDYYGNWPASLLAKDYPAWRARHLPAKADSKAAVQPPPAAENWPGFRGPTYQGLSTDTGLPIRWSATENVAWKTPTPGDGWSSPIVWEDRVFVTTTTAEGTSCRVLAVDRLTGNIVWDKEVFQQDAGHRHRRNTYATPTPCTDGELIYAVFGDGSFVALDFDGAIKWVNRDFPFYGEHGLGTSPVLWHDLLIMTRDGSGAGRADRTPANTGFRFGLDCGGGHPL